MKAIYAWMIGAAGAAILITLYLLQSPWALSLSASPLEENAAIQSVLHQYPGEVLESKRLNDAYLIMLQRPKGKYEIQVNAYNGHIDSIRRTQAYTDTTQEPQKNTPSSPKPDPVSLVITEKEAAQLAAKAVNGGTTDDIELHRNEKSLYYLVEVDVKDGREAVVQVNAVSGSIDSVTWEKEKQDNED
ncbi:peptidase M4 [Paenibacillus sp. IHB B 3084]|uniref:PepSY domain-containing protein n=1 Tax=unclassified Paenibacillus TaxID=185978 RepID=UPI000721E9C1|nr:MULTISPECIES: PepSY domain-containing protein [unclassified Paenibacillus]ALP35424.1 peptidase M4 [Paenibacillus sp. IHB B 3084]MBE0337873.1 peptidase M4 [Paenibacillus sp. 23TSA30-6]